MTLMTRSCHFTSKSAAMHKAAVKIGDSFNIPCEDVWHVMCLMCRPDIKNLYLGNWLFYGFGEYLFDADQGESRGKELAIWRLLRATLKRNGGVTMTIQSDRPPIFGMNCTQCGDLLIAPEWSEYEDERHILNLWSCTNCGYHFETETLLPAAKAMDDAATMKAFFPSLLV